MALSFLGVILDSTIATFDCITIYLNGDCHLYEKMHFVEKVVNFDMWFVTGIYRSDDAEILSGDRLGGDTKKWHCDFWNFDFTLILRGLKSEIWSTSAIFGLWPLKITKNQNLKNPLSIFCITLNPSLNLILASFDL